MEIISSRADSPLLSGISDEPLCLPYTKFAHLSVSLGLGHPTQLVGTRRWSHVSIPKAAVSRYLVPILPLSFNSLQLDIISVDSSIMHSPCWAAYIFGTVLLTIQLFTRFWGDEYLAAPLQLSSDVGLRS